MPQASSSKTPANQRASDKEAKRQRGALSCAECRRLKLKCDKTVPCSSCKRRGCSAICPNGSLITGQGTRFVLADTEKLHQKIAHMSDRIRQLEDALSILQSSTSLEPHPLLDRELLKIKSSIELHAAVNGEESGLPQEEAEDSQYIDAFGTLAIRDDGAATFYGRSAGSESLLIGEHAVNGSQYLSGSSSSMSMVSSPDIPPSVSNLSSSFPFGAAQAGVDLDYIIHNYLPSWEEACRLTGLYLEQAPWFFGAVTKRQLEQEMLPLWYTQGAAHSPPLASVGALGGPSAATVTPNHGGAHELALMFIIFCFGALTDISLPPAPDNAPAEQFYSITKAALTLEPVLDRPPSVATVQVLSLMAIYEGLRSGENSIESTWSLMGMATKLAQSIGLHRDCARWNLTPSEVQKRRALFWEIFITDSWQSLATGRLATFSLPFVDCELPFDADQTIGEDGSAQPSFPFWKARFGAECVSAVVQGTLTSRAPKYSIILELDRKVRDMELPAYAQGPPPQGLGLKDTMSHFMPTNYRELTLLYIHRCFFAHAIASNPNDPISTQYAPSFLAGYRSACDLLASVKTQFTLFPAEIARFWVLWTHAFSSVVMISSVVTNGSKCKVAPAALLELKAAADLFESAATYGGRSKKFLPIIRRLQVKAQKVFYETCNGIPPKIPGDIFRPSGEDHDDISVFSGKTRTVTTRVKSSPTSRPSTSRPSPPAQGPPSSRAPSDSPPQVFAHNPSFANVHPSLMNELVSFEGHLTNQLQHAHAADSDGYNTTLLGQSAFPRQSKPQAPSLHIQTHPTLSQSPEVQQYQPYPAPQYTQQQQMQTQEDHHSQHHDQPHTPHSQLIPPAPRGQPYPSNSYQQQRSLSTEMQYEYSDPNYTTPSPMEQHPHGVPAPAPQHSLSHAGSQPSLRYTSQYSQQQTPQHQMHPVPAEYMRRQQSGSTDPISPTSSKQSQYSSPATMLDPRTTHWQQQQQMQGNGSHAHHNQRQEHYSGVPTQELYYQQGMRPMQHYTPSGAMRGIAAEDEGLQATWQSYMSKVGTPRHIFED